MHLFLAASGNLAALVLFMSMLASVSFLQLQKTATIRHCAFNTARYLQSSCQAERHDENSSNKAKAIFVLGGPGSGKGTQCEKFSKEYGISHLSAGDLLRREISTGSELGRTIDNVLKQGKIVPVSVSLGLLRTEMQLLKQDRYLIDGFPRNYDNIEGWETIMPSVCDIEMVVFLECSEKEMEKRLLHRGLTSNRADDNAQVVKKRFQTYQEVTQPVIAYFTEKMKERLVILNGDRSQDVVYNDLKLSFAPFARSDLERLNRQVTRETPGYQNMEVDNEHLESNGLDGKYSCTLKGSNQKPFNLQRQWRFQEGQWRLVSQNEW